MTDLPLADGRVKSGAGSLTFFDPSDVEEGEGSDDVLAVVAGVGTGEGSGDGSGIGVEVGAGVKTAGTISVGTGNRAVSSVGSGPEPQPMVASKAAVTMNRVVQRMNPWHFIPNPP